MDSFSPQDAASRLFEAHGDEVYRYIRYTIGDASQADDILQEVFLRVLQSWDRFQHRSSPKTWLWSITKNCLRDYFRSQKYTRHHVPLDSEIRGHHVPDELFRGHEFLKVQLEESLQGLSVMQREVFVERIIHEKSTEETAKTLGWSVSKVKTTLHRAMKQVKKSFQEGGDTGE